jgi:hypothetical protein
MLRDLPSADGEMMADSEMVLRKSPHAEVSV